jgi:hypothetical protein
MSSQQIISHNATQPDNKRTFFPLSRADMLLAWPAISEFLKGRRGSFMDKWDETSFVNELHANHNMHLWIAHNGSSIDGVMLVQFVCTPAEITLWITGVYCEGIKNYLHLSRNLEQWAVLMGAGSIVFDGAHAWKRLLKRLGYSTPTAMLKKDLKNLWSN